VRELLEAHPLHRTAHAAHLKTLLDHLGGVEPAQLAQAADEPSEPLRERELAVLRFLPTNLSAGEIASELLLSVHTVKTHMRKLYAKLDVHTRADAVQRGRARPPGAGTARRLTSAHRRGASSGCAPLGAFRSPTSERRASSGGGL
jgi:LuxR family maltose regulon positive regulatory protein